jgi:multiple antibiotic resistance protein
MLDVMQEILVVTISLFAIVDPIACVPVFMSFFGGSERKKRRRAATEAVLAASVLLVGFAAFGLALLTYLNISISAFMIAGGILLMFLAFEFLMGSLPRTRRVESDTSDAVVPIGTPLLTGPGAITSAIYFTHIYGLAVTFIAIVIVMIISLLTLLGSTKLTGVLGKNGLRVITRIMGLITAAIAISLIEKAMIAYGFIQAASVL